MALIAVALLWWPSEMVWVTPVPKGGGRAVQLRLCAHSFVSQEDEGGLVNNRVNKLKWMLKHTVSNPHLFQQNCGPLQCCGIPTCFPACLPCLCMCDAVVVQREASCLGEDHFMDLRWHALHALHVQDDCKRTGRVLSPGLPLCWTMLHMLRECCLLQMGSDGAFERRKMEMALIKPEHNISDDQVVDSCVLDAHLFSTALKTFQCACTECIFTTADDARVSLKPFLFGAVESVHTDGMHASAWLLMMRVRVHCLISAEVCSPGCHAARGCLPARMPAVHTPMLLWGSARKCEKKKSSDDDLLIGDVCRSACPGHAVLCALHRSIVLACDAVPADDLPGDPLHVLRYVNSVMPGHPESFMLEYLEKACLVHIWNGVLFVHGGMSACVLACKIERGHHTPAIAFMLVYCSRQASA